MNTPIDTQLTDPPALTPSVPAADVSPGGARTPQTEREALLQGQARSAEGDEERERALAAYIAKWCNGSEANAKLEQLHGFKSGYDAVRAVYERKVADEQTLAEQAIKQCNYEQGRAERAEEKSEKLEDYAAELKATMDRYADRAEKAEARVRELATKLDAMTHLHGNAVQLLEQEESRARVLEQDNDEHTKRCYATEAALVTERERNAKLRAALEYALTCHLRLPGDVNQKMLDALSATTPDAAPAVDE